MGRKNQPRLGTIREPEMIRLGQQEQTEGTEGARRRADGDVVVTGSLRGFSRDTQKTVGQ